MPLPKKTIRVFPNPWGFIHHDIGPQGRCHEDTGGRGTTPRYIGSEPCPVKTVKLADYESQPNETRLDTWLSVFRFFALDASLTGPAEGFEHGIELPKTPYYLDRLRDGDLIPADERSGEHGARFASLAEAKAAGIAEFDANYGDGSFAGAFQELSGTAASPKTRAVSDVASAGLGDASTPVAVATAEPAPLAFSTSPEVATSAETPNAKRAARAAASGADK